MKTKNIIINSAALFVIASILQTFLHEFAHFITAILLQAKNVSIFHNYVDYNSELLTLNSKILIASAGPLFSLIVGILFHFICSKLKHRNLSFLFSLYLSIFGYINFFGYLMIAPFFIEGDTGYIFNKLGLAFWITLIISFIGILSIYFILKILSKYFAELGTKEILENPLSRRQFSDALIKYPLAIGIISTAILNLPIPVFLSILYPLFSPFAIMFCYGNVLREKYTIEIYNDNFSKIENVNPLLLIFLVLSIIFNRLLVIGFSFN